MMRGVRRLFLLLIVAGAAFAAQAGRMVTVEPATPIFRAPSFDAPLLGIANRAFQAEEKAEKLVLVSRHPLARYHRFSELLLPDGQTGYVNIHLTATERGTFRSGNVIEWWRLTLLPLFAGGVLAAAAAAWKFRNEPGRRSWLFLALTPILLRQFLLLLLVNAGQNMMPNPADEPGYYANLTDFLAGDFSRRWHFTVGTSLFYLPFELISGTRNLTDILLPLCWTEGFLLAPLSLGLGFLIARRLTGSSRIAFAAMLLWAVLPFLCHHQPDFVHKIFQVWLGMPSTGFTYQHYINLIGCGFNAMSDTPSTCLVLLTMTALLYLPVSWKSAALSAFLFALACLFRINNILFLPVVAVLALFHRRGYFTRATLPAALGAGFAAFLLGFLPQLLVNLHCFGNPLRFSYTNYAEGAHTYLAWIFVELTSVFYLSANGTLWSLALLSLLLMRNRKLRLELLVWILPVTLFFFAYSHGTDDPVRFILTAIPALCLAVAASGVWNNFRLPDAACAATVVAGWFLAPLNLSAGDWSFYGENPLQMILRRNGFGGAEVTLLLLAAAGTALLATRKHRRAALLLGGVTLFHLFGNACWLLCLFPVLLIIALRDMVRFRREAIQKKNSGTAQITQETARPAAPSR